MTVPTRIPATNRKKPRSEEHTSELQSQSNLVCRLLLEKKTSARFVDRHPITKVASTRPRPSHTPPTAAVQTRAGGYEYVRWTDPQRILDRRAVLVASV